MILDGYDKFAELSVKDEILRIEYRPALRHERLALANRCAFLGEYEMQQMLTGEISRRTLNPDAENHLDPESPWWWVLLKCVLGIDPKTTERDDAANLREGVRLHVQHPFLTTLSCADCKTWWLDPLTGQVSKRGGRAQTRPPEAVLLCQTQQGCPKGAPEKPQTLSAKNQQALRHYYECRATGQFPDDAIVRQNAVIIQKALSHA